MRSTVGQWKENTNGFRAVVAFDFSERKRSESVDP